MPYYMYVAVNEDNKISVFTVDPDGGGLTHRHDVAVEGGPFTLAISPDRNHLYAGCRENPQLASFNIDQSGGGLTRTGTVPLASWPVFVATDRRGGFVLSSYYQGAGVAVHPIGGDGSVGGAPVVSLDTATGAHGMQTDVTNSYAFVPHIAGNGPNQIWQFRFDEDTGQITPNSPAIVELEEFLGPRHFCFHPSLDVLYFSNEQGCSVSGYRLDTSNGTLSLIQTITTLPPEGFAERNTCSQIQITGSGRFLYAPNRGHDSVACYTVDTATGELASNGIVASEARPNALCLGPHDRFIYSAGQDSGQMAIFRVDQDSGALHQMETVPLGGGPCWISVVELPG